jgi:DNA polymerase III subunit delta
MAAPPMYLFAGPEELLLRRAAERLLDELRSAAGELEVVDLRAPELGEQGLPDLRTGSLFGTPRAVLIRQAEQLPATLSQALVAELEGAPPEATVILLASGTQRIMKLAKRIKELGGRFDVAPPRDFEDKKWASLIAEEFRRHGRAADQAAVGAILQHAGTDVGTIAEKVAQVCAAAAPGRVGAAQVEEVVFGHGSRGAFAVADAMCDRNPQEAMVLLRGAMEAGQDPVMILGALAYRVRSIVAVAGGLAPKEVGLNITSGQANRLKGVRRNFGPGELTRAYRALAEADVEIKSGELPAELVIERAVLEIASRR